MITAIKRSLTNSYFIRNVITVAGGTAASQFLLLLSLPFLSRLYSADAFGELAFYTSALVMIGPALSLEYSQSILYASSRTEAYLLFKLVFTVSLAFTGLLLAACVFIYVVIFPELYIILIPLGCWLQGLLLAFINLYNRVGKFRITSLGKMMNAFVSILVSLALFMCWPTAYGLIAGHILGLLAAVLYFFITSGSILSSRLFMTWQEMKGMLKKKSEYPKVLLPSSFLNNFINHIPIYLLGYFFDASVVGYFTRSRQVLSLPISQIATSVGDVFRQRANTNFLQGKSSKELYVKTFLSLLAASVPFVLIIVFLGPFLFRIAFGEEWVTAGVYSVYLIPMFALRFINTPLGSMFYVTGRFKEAFALNILLLVLVLAAIGIAGLLGASATIVIACFAAAYAVSYLVGMLRSYYLTLRV
jgi:O-antigen/teichoic acid export membrane protein